MKKFLGIALALFLTAGCATAGLGGSTVSERSGTAPSEVAERPSGQDLRLATWNVRNFFDTVDDKYDDEVLSMGEFRTKIDRLRQVVDRLDADFLALEEVENMECLRSLNASLSSPYPELGLLEGNDHQRGIDVAFLSRLPVKSVISHARDPLPEVPGAPSHYHFSRDCLEVHLDTEPPLIVLVNHLKSSRGNAKKSAAKRRAQSLRIVEIASEVDLPKETAVVVMGDLNDVAGSWSLEPLFEHLSDALKSVPESERITHRYKKSGTGIDHILTDDDGARITGGAKIWRGLGVDTSDHDPVSVQINVTLKSAAVPKAWE